MKAIVILLSAALAAFAACREPSQTTAQPKTSPRVHPQPRNADPSFQPVVLGSGRLGQMPIGDTLAVNGQESVSGSATVDDGFVSEAVVYDVRAYGALCNGSTDDSTAISDAINAALAGGGGIVQFPAANCVWNACYTIPFYATTGFNTQNSLRITGAAYLAGNQGGGSPVAEPGTVLTMGCSSGVGKIISRGFGHIEIDHVQMVEPNFTTTTPFFYDTLTTPTIHDMQFYGNFALGGSGQDAIILGGTDGGDGTNLITSAFAGYPPFVQRVSFYGVQRGSTAAARATAACTPITRSLTLETAEPAVRRSRSRAARATARRATSSPET